MNRETSTLRRLNPGRYKQFNSHPVPDDVSNAAISIHHPPHQQKSTKPNYSNNLLISCLKSLFMAIVISLFFLLVSIITIIIHILVAGPVLHRRRCRHRRTTTTTTTTTRPLPNSLELEEDYNYNVDHFCGVGFGLSHSDLQKFPSFNYFKQAAGFDEPSSTQDCIVCLEDFREGEVCRMLPKCKHVFHANCVDSWLIRVPACPICRQEVIKSKIDRLPIRSNVSYSSLIRNS